MRSSTHAFEHQPPLPSSPRSIAVARHFGVLEATVGQTRTRRLGKLDREPARPDLRTPRRRDEPPIVELPAPGEILLLTGASGSGKSSLLRAMRKRLATSDAAVDLIDLRRLALPERPVVDLFDDDDPSQAEAEPHAFAPILRRLARVGLAEVWTWLRPPSQLSEGQRWRLRVALAMHAIDRTSVTTSAGQAPRPTLIVCDEFAAVLDRVTAFVIARVIRRFIDARADRVAALVATSHDDVRAPLDPERVVECDFGAIRVLRRGRRRPASPARAGGDQ